MLLKFGELRASYHKIYISLIITEGIDFNLISYDMHVNTKGQFM